MAVGMLLAGEGITEESYRQLTEAMFGNYPCVRTSRRTA